MRGNFKTEVYGLKLCSSKTKETDLTRILFDDERYHAATTWIQVSAGDFVSVEGESIKTKYQYFDEQKIEIVQNNQTLFSGSFEELCKILSKTT